MKDQAMTKAERDELMRLVRRREKLAKADADTVAAAREADFEAQLAKRYGVYHEAWRDAYQRARQAVEDTNDRIRREFEENGIPIEFAPSAHVGWQSRGENVTAERRAELRKIAKTRIAADAKQTKAQIERASVAVQEELVTGTLESDEARRFLERMPTADALMPAAPTVAELEAALPRRPRDKTWDEVMATANDDDEDGDQRDIRPAAASSPTTFAPTE